MKLRLKPACRNWRLMERETGSLAAGTPLPLFRKCSFQRTLSAVFLEVFILKGLRANFAEVRILKGLVIDGPPWRVSPGDLGGKAKNVDAGQPR